MNEPDIAPLARRLAEENRVDWRRLRGSGEGGEVVERDVLAYLARVMAGEEEAVAPAPDVRPEGAASSGASEARGAPFAAPGAGAAGPDAPGEDARAGEPSDDADGLLLAGDDLGSVEEDPLAGPADGRVEPAPADPFGDVGGDLVWDVGTPDPAPRAADASEAGPAAEDAPGAWIDQAPPAEPVERSEVVGDATAGPAIVRGRPTLRRYVALDGVRAVERLLAARTGEDRLARAALLLLAARRAGDRLELARPVVVRPTDEGTVRATAEDGSLGATARALATPAEGPVHDADLYVADLSGLDLDEAVLDVEGPQLTLGRAVDAPDGPRAVLALTGDVPPERGAAFLAAVAELVEEPLALLV